MANFNEYPNGEPIIRAGGANAASLPAYTVFENTLDFTERNLASGDTVLEFLSIPAGSIVQHVMLDVINADDNAATVAVTDGAAGALHAAQAVNAVGKTNGGGAAIGTFYPLGTTIALTVGAADASTGRIRVAVMVANGG